MRHAAAMPTADRLDCPRAPNVLASVLRMAEDMDSPDFIERPKSTVAAADRAVAVNE